MSALVILDTEGSGVVSPDREEISRLCKLLHQRLLAAMGPVETRRNVRRSERPNVAGGTPLFFVSIASKGLSQDVSLLFATLAGRSISVAVKGLKRVVGGPDPVGAGAVHGAKETTGSTIGVVEGQADER